MSRNLYYCCDGRHLYTFGVFAAFYAKEIGSALRIIPYQKIDQIESFPPGAYIFTDFDRLTPRARARLGKVVDDFEAGGWLVLNHPSRARGRFDLLRTLHAEGLNNFNVYRLAGWREAKRFPVFIRAEGGHGNVLTKLLPTSLALQDEVERLTREGAASPDLMIVEFGNARGADGKFRKYSAYRVGNEIYAQHCFSSREWWIKYADNEFGEAEYEEHLNYVAENPHRDQLKKIFDLARIDYGRIDYCVVNDAIQTFEINTNPTVLQITAARQGDMSSYARLHEDALKALLERVPQTPALANRLFNGRSPRHADEMGTEWIEFTKATWPDAAPSAVAPSQQTSL
ncbi:MAG TPA: hypothetical protein VJ859_05765 [Allosphingosinicella sp.]|nr:hypothetical protein [Allosphingosinicella sp.]